MYYFGVVDLVRPLDKCAVNIKPLSDKNSRFTSNTTMEIIIAQLFVENWTTSIEFKAYYKRCAPKYCTYPTWRRFDRTYMIATMVGFYGSLSAILEIVLPLLVKYVRKRWQKQGLIHHTTTGNQLV